VLNGFGRTLGDSIVGVQALAAALASSALPGLPVLFRLPGLPAVVQQTYDAAGDLCSVRELPWACETPATPFPPAAGFAHVIDIRDFAFDPGFRGVAMIDFFLRALGFDPAAVPPGWRRNAWLAPRLRPVPPAGIAPGYVLVCPRTSTKLRDMPEEVHAAVVASLLSAGHRVLTQGAPPPGATGAARCTTLAELAGLVAAAKFVVSADTAMPHLADAFGVPCLAFFTTHRPEWRVRDYPRCRAVHLPVPGLPAALEFSRGPEDDAAARAAWFVDGDDLGWVDRAVGAALAEP
jgi:Glycosyltransferase family 9 (heptosyltransferase)